MALHFSDSEFAGRLEKLRAEMRSAGLDAMLLFAPDSQFWLTGYDTFGFCFFQCLIVTHDKEPSLLTRSADLRQAQLTSNMNDIRVWKDAADSNPANDLHKILTEMNLRGKVIGVEYDTHGLTAHNGKRVDKALLKFASLTDASAIIPALRLIKSPAEIEYVRKAGQLGDACLTAAMPHIKAGADESDILAALQAENFRLGGDYPANEFIIGSGEYALLCRYKSGRGVLGTQDQLTLEWAGVYRHYHAALMRTILIGEPDKEHLEMHAAGIEALQACESKLKPGMKMADVFEAHATTLDRLGFSNCRLNACGYSLGARFTPTWMEPHMFYEGNPTEIRPNMVFFLHMILANSESGLAMTLGRTSLVTETGSELLCGENTDLLCI